MNGKKARGRRLALRRAADSTPRLARKAAGVERNEKEREVDRIMSDLRSERSATIKDANRVYTEAEKAAADSRRASLQAADKTYIEKRDKAIRRLAKAEGSAAA